MELNKSTLIEQVKLLLNKIEEKSRVRESHEWYLTNNLNRFIQRITIANTGNEIKIAAQIFTRYCSDSMDWDTEIYKICSNIIKLAFLLAKNYDQEC